MSTVNLKKMTPDERQALMHQLEQEQRAEQKARAKKRREYEKNRERRVQKVIKGVMKLEAQMSAFKEEVSSLMAEQHSELDEYGLIPAKSKGGFSVLSNDGNFKITRSRDTDPKWDETAIKGAQLIKEFLVKKGQSMVDQSVYDLLMSLLEKNKDGDLEFSRVMLFLQNEDKFNDPEWKEGLRLLKEGYHLEFKKFGYQFFKKDKDGKYRAISINFSNL